MKMPEMMGAWLAETDRIRSKKDAPTVAEEFFISLTLEFDRAMNNKPPNHVRYVEFLLQAVEMYLSGKPDEAMAKFFSAAPMQGISGEFTGKQSYWNETLATTLMLEPENRAMGRRTAKCVGASPAGLYIYVENVDKIVDKATKLGATSQGPVMDMFWGDRCCTVVDPDGYTWMGGTHKAEPSAKEMKQKMAEMMKQQPAGAAAAD